MLPIQTFKLTPDFARLHLNHVIILRGTSQTFVVTHLPVDYFFHPIVHFIILLLSLTEECSNKA